MIVPALLWGGYSIPEAQTALLIATIPQNIGGVWSLRDTITVERIAIPAMARVLFFPAGIFVLLYMESLPVMTLRQIVGGFVLVATLATILLKPKPQERIHPGWSWIAFPLSGFLQGLVGMGGPIMVFWAQAHDWDTRQVRGFLFAMYLASIVPALGFLYYSFGERIFTSSLATVMLIPLLLLVTMFGLKFGTLLGTKRLRTVTLGLLLILGLAGLAAPLFHL